MKKQRKSKVSRKRGADPAVAAAEEKAVSRRRFLRLARNGSIALPVIAGATVFSVRSVQATICEADLTKIGKGKPAIVQIHDPMCSLCRDLQRQARKALKEFDDGAVTFLVADINTEKGGAFAARYGVPHVTLLLFDPEGEMVEIVRGPSDTNSLRGIFKAHFQVSG